MLLEKKRQSTLPRIGELFVEAGLVKAQTVSECLLIAKRAQLPLGRVLVMSGYVSAPDVDCAVQTQQLIKAGRVTREAAKRLVRRVHCNKISIEEAQAAESFDRAFSLSLSELGKLLLAAHILPEEVIVRAARKSAEEKLPLGRYLVDQGTLAPGLLMNALNCVIYIRDNRLSCYDAAKVMRSAYFNGFDLPAALIENQLESLIESATPRLLDLLRESALLQEEHVSLILESALESGSQSGQILLAHGLVSENTLEAALELQRMLAAGTIKLRRASELLVLCQEMKVPLETLLAELDNLNQVVEFLRRGQIFDEGRIRAIAAVTEDFDSCSGSTLVREGILTHPMLTRAVRCLAYFRSAALTERQAITIFIMSMEMDVSPEEAMWHINWDANNRYGSSELLGKTA